MNVIAGDGRNEHQSSQGTNRPSEKSAVASETPMLKHLLGEFLTIESVSAAVVIGRDGFVIESAVSGNVDLEALGAMASTGFGTSAAMGTALEKGDLCQLLVELQKGPVLLAPLSTEELIAIVADSAAHIGRIRYDLRKNRDRIIAAL